MHDPLARQPGHGDHREHPDLAQLAETRRDDQKGQPAERNGHRHALQHAARHHPSAHRDVVDRKRERAERGVQDSEQKTFPPIAPVRRDS
jgi:hypothetical protein